MQGPGSLFLHPIPLKFASQRKALGEESIFLQKLWDQVQIHNISWVQRSGYLTPGEQLRLTGEIIDKCKKLISENHTRLTAQYEAFLTKLASPVPYRTITLAEYGKRARCLVDSEVSYALHTHIIGAKILGDFFLSEEGLKKAGILMTTSVPKCTSFAFYHLNDAFSIREALAGVSLEALKIPDVKFVSQPRPGDLVMYAKIEAGNVNPQHYGIYQGDGLVLSKWGAGPVMEHQTGQVPLSYGHSLMYLRKKFRFHVSRKVIEQIDAAKKSLEGSCRHPLCAASLSQEGVKKVFLEFLEESFQEHEKTAFVHSIYGVKVLKPLLSSIRERVAEISSEDATHELLLKSFRRIVKVESLSLRLDFTIHRMNS